MKKTYRAVFEIESDSWDSLHQSMAEILRNASEAGALILEVKEAEYHDVPPEFRNKC